MIRLQFRKEIKQQYDQKVQKCYRTPRFGLIKINQLGDLDSVPLENIISEAKKLTSIMTSLIFGVGSTLKSPLTSYLASMKLLAILVIICRSAYWNKSNCIPLLVTMYIYSASAKVDAITFFNRLGLSVLYNMLLRKLRGITSSSTAFFEK